MRYLATRPDGAELREDYLYHKRAYDFNNEVQGMHYGEFANYTEPFARALLADSSYPPNLEEGSETGCVTEAIKQSAQRRQPVTLAPLLANFGLSP